MKALGWNVVRYSSLKPKSAAEATDFFNSYFVSKEPGSWQWPPCSTKYPSAPPPSPALSEQSQYLYDLLQYTFGGK